ncbi:MAG: hypothetical protein ABI678_00125 [Kofleriaceae bacterium]
MPRLLVDEVFTPTTFPTHTYVERPQLTLEQTLTPWLRASTTVAMLSGPSKAGKTVLIQNVVGNQNLITVSGASISVADQLWDRVLDWIGEPNTLTASTTHSDAKAQTTEGTTSAGFPGVASFQGKGSKTGTTGGAEAITATAGRQGLPQVVREIANSGYTVLVDDFHYINPAVQTLVAQQIKDAASRGIRICVASVPHRADQAVRALGDLRGRAISIDLEYWSTADLLRIAQRGCGLLGLNVDNDSLQFFAVEAAGSPQLMQAICLWMCLHLGVRETQSPPLEVMIDTEARRAILNMTSRMTDFRSLVGALVQGPKTRGQDRKRYDFVAEGGGGDVYLAIMRSIASDPPRLTFGYDELTTRIRRIADEAPSGASVVGSCYHLGEIAKDFPGPSGQALEWDSDDQVLTIPDPYLLFYLRWSDHLQRESRVEAR